MDFRDKLMELRKQKGWSQEELGNSIGVSRQTISKWEAGQTVPEMNNLLELSRLFGISLDELTGNEGYEHPAKGAAGEKVVERIVYVERKSRYEYKSKQNWRGLPLIHINIESNGFCRAKGVVAVGNVATGLIAVGIFSAGILSVGVIGVGLLALGCIALGLAASGCFAVGLVAAGGIAIGGLAVGGLTRGIYAIGGVAKARDIAMGGVAEGYIAIGREVSGTVTYQCGDDWQKLPFDEIRKEIFRVFPHIWSPIVRLFTLH